MEPSACFVVQQLSKPFVFFSSYSEVTSEELRLAKSKLQSTNVNDGEPKLVPQKLKELELEKEFVVQYLQ